VHWVIFYILSKHALIIAIAFVFFKDIREKANRYFFLHTHTHTLIL